MGVLTATSRDSAPAVPKPGEYFDLTGRGAAAIHCLTSLLDERQQHLPYFDVKYDARPPVAVHIRWDYGDGVGRYVDALHLARIMSGSGVNRAADAALEGWLFRLLGEDGLSWWPDSPYRLPHPSGQPGRMADVTWTQRSTLAALTTLFLETGDTRAATAARRLVDRLNGIAVWRDGMAYFPEEATRFRPGDVLYPPGGWSSRNMLTAGWFGAILGTLIWPLARFAAAAGYDPAIRLARGLAEFALRGAAVFHADGRFRDLVQGHFYARTTTASGLLSLGVLTGHRPYVEMAERIYRQARQWGTSFGWFPEDLSVPACETCCTKDMIEIAIGLARHVDPGYWSDAERFGRNHLLESQLLRTDWIGRYQPPRPPALPPEDALRLSRERVLERWRGGFAGWSAVNDWVFPGKGGMACCNASGARALYDLWHHAVSRDDSGVSIHLLFSRATEDVVVRSYLPFEGRLEVRMRSGRPVRVRLPRSAAAASVRVQHNGAPATVPVREGYVSLPRAQPGDAVEVRFALDYSEEKFHLGYQSYRIRYRGDTVVSIEPPGKICPLYDRGWASQAAPPVAEPPLPSAREIESI